MAADFAQPVKKLTREGLSVLVRLTRDLARAMAQGNLDRALEILEERRRLLQGFSWPQEADPAFWQEVRALRDLEQEVAAFCRTWREVVEKRLCSLNTGHFLRLTYCPPVEEARFINVSK
ncbi:MAG: hypothetical protein WAU47_09755 [Desulfobaccales bacterium]